MPDVFELALQNMARLHGQVGIFALHGLYASQLIQADRAFPILRPFRRAPIQLTPLHNFLVALFIGHLRQPIAEAVRLQTPFLSRCAACRGEICATIPRRMTSSAISRPVH